VTDIVEWLRGAVFGERLTLGQLAEAADEIERLREILTAIAEGYPTSARDDRYVIVDNPRYTPTNGEAPNLVWEKQRG
jgi:hypothetical protein